MINICNNKKTEYFLIEDFKSEGATIDDLKAMGIEMYITFQDDGTFCMKFGEEMNGTWDDSTMTVDGEAQPYTLDGDVLTLAMGDEFAIFRRSDAPPVREPNSGKTCEASFEDSNQKTWLMSAVCPEGWFHSTTPPGNNVVFSNISNFMDESAWTIVFISGFTTIDDAEGFALTKKAFAGTLLNDEIAAFDKAVEAVDALDAVVSKDDDAPKDETISTVKDDLQNLKDEIDAFSLKDLISITGDPLKFTVNGITWEGAFNKEDMAFDLVSVVTDETGMADFLMINSKGIDPNDELFQKTLASFKLEKQ